MNATATAGALARHAGALAVDPRATAADRQEAAQAAAAAYAATLTGEAAAALAAEYARQGLAGHPDPRRHFDRAWR